MKESIHVLGPTYIDHTIRLQDNISFDGSSRIENEDICPGGTGLCYAVALSRLGNGVTLHSIVGTDERAHLIQEALKNEENISTHWQIYDGSTDYAYILIDKGNHKTVASRKEVSNHFDPSPATDNLTNAKAVILTSFHNDISLKVVHNIENRNQVKPYIMWAPHLPNCDGVSNMTPKLRLIDHITLSSEEFARIYDKVGNPIDHGVKSITITSGKNGCDLLTKDGYRHFNPIHVVENPVDTNGAGEAFGSGFITTYLETHDYDSAVNSGSYMGFLHIHRKGSDFPKMTKNELISLSQSAKLKIQIPVRTSLAE